MRTAYINKENRVVYVAAFAEDKISVDAKGKLLFTAGDYDAETRSYAHILGRGEEVFAVEGNGLNVGDIYIPPLPIAPASEPAQKSLQEAVDAKRSELDAMRKQVLNAQADEDEALLQSCVPKGTGLNRSLEF